MRFRNKIDNKIYWIVSWISVPTKTGWFKTEYKTYIYCKDEQGESKKFLAEDILRYE